MAKDTMVKGVPTPLMNSLHESFHQVDSETSAVFSERYSGESKEGDLSLRQSLARKENQAVRGLRLIMFFVLITVAAVASVGVFCYTTDNEKKEFETDFMGQGLKVIDGFQGDSFRKLQALETLSRSITAYTLDSGSKWPFVTIPDSANHFQPYLSLVNAASLLVMPIVAARQRSKWERYSVVNQGWIDKDLKTQQQFTSNGRYLQEQQETNATMTRLIARDLQLSSDTLREEEENNISWYIKNYVGIDTSPGSWVVWWQYAPVLHNRWFINFNRMAVPGFAEEIQSVRKGCAIVSKTWTFDRGLDFQSTQDLTLNADLLKAGGNGEYVPGEPVGYIHYPIFDSYNPKNRETAAILTATIYWRTYFQDILPETVKGIICVVENSKGQAFTYQVNGPKAMFLGMDDLHDDKYNDFVIEADYSTFANNTLYTGVSVDENQISYRIKVYPSQEFEDTYNTSKPILYTSAMLFIFLFTAVIFITYDFCVERRQEIVMKAADSTDRVLTSLFPENVRDRLIEEVADANKTKSKDILEETKDKSKPIADFFPQTTIMFADIRGFTAWCSEREPAQVFTLLETLYNTFDKIAERRDIFKVETIGDCYVAVAGLPKPRDDHAVAMCRFANSCLEKVHVLTEELELELGYGTADLTMRFGLHSGPVTAGVLRGEKSRFQLFGDTVNTASRMESTGFKDKIQVSQATADLVRAAGKGHWLTPREETVFANGKGEMQTFWVDINGASPMISEATFGSDCDYDSDQVPDVLTNLKRFETIADYLQESFVSESFVSESYYSESMAFDCQNENSGNRVSHETERLVNWNVGVLEELLEQIVSLRNAQPNRGSVGECWENLKKTKGTARDEIKEVIELPELNIKTLEYQKKALENKVALSNEVKDELQDFVTSIALLYNENAFHKFEHATHMAMQVNKFMHRVVLPTNFENESETLSVEEMAEKLHKRSWGISSDPLSQFACIFASLVHDVDHKGVSNSELMKEDDNLAAMYEYKSVAEQFSVDVAWNLLMDERYGNLRTAICSSSEELQRFRDLVVNCVMATDVFDKELTAFRKWRWKLAFARSTNEYDNFNRRATIVIETLIQASDVSHTMQHWHIYRKWNENLFNEMSQAYKLGRSGTDPADNWYQGELNFFDFYVIPLAKKLHECGAFGVLSDECLVYAENNRQEWEEKGKSIVEEMVRNRGFEKSLLSIST